MISFQINFIEENKPLGTAGSLTLLKDSLTNSFFYLIVIQLLVITVKLLIFITRTRTLSCFMHHHTIPYGVCEIENGGDLVRVEKPEYDFLTNTMDFILSILV